MSATTTQPDTDTWCAKHDAPTNVEHYVHRVRRSGCPYCTAVAEQVGVMLGDDDASQAMRRRERAEAEIELARIVIRDNEARVAAATQELLDIAFG